MKTGQCLCGAITLSTDALKPSVGACHCDTCRRWGGGPLVTIEPEAELRIDGETHMTRYRSSDWAERAFCSRCGTHLFYRLIESGQTFLTAGFFQHDESWLFDHQVFIDEKPDYYAFANKTRDMTGAELFAMFSGDNQT